MESLLVSKKKKKINKDTDNDIFFLNFEQNNITI